MTLLAIGRRRSEATPSDRAIDALDQRVLDWTNAVTVVALADVPGAASFREQDDIIWDAQGAEYLFYFSAQIGGASHVWRTTSADGAVWTAPVPCTQGGSALVAEDPSLVQTFRRSAPSLHRDGSGLMWMYAEDNATSVIKVLSSMDGIEWTLGNASVIPRGQQGAWDSTLTGSPVARFDGSRYIVGYEGIDSPVERFGLAIGATPTALTKHAANPVISAAAFGKTSQTAFADSMWVSPDGAAVHVTGHAGSNGDVSMFRAYSTKLNPSTWALGDFTLIGNVDTVRNDLTVWQSGDRLVTAPADDLSLVIVPLKAP